MTDASQPDGVEDPKPDQDEQALVGTGNEQQDDLETAREMATIVPMPAKQLDSATLPGIGPPPEKVVLDGDSIPGYDLLGELGRGGMGVVYKARDQKLKRIVALKMILSGTHASDEDMQRFQTEAEAVARLQHPNIVQIFEVAEHEGRPYIALEFADGGSLEQKIAGTPQNAAESAQLVETLSRAIQQAHENEIIHRDLKPANILLTADGVPRITDFGLAKRLDEDSSQTKSGAVMGTPSYMAPEQAASTSDTLGPAADTYSLGAILYHMLTGRPPFQAETQLDTIMQVISEEPVAPRKLNSSLPVDLETICLKCLEKDVHRRYESAESLAEDLRRFQAGHPIEARPVSTITRTLKWARRRPAVAGMIGISAAALVALVAGGFWYNAQLIEERDIARLDVFSLQSINRAEKLTVEDPVQAMGRYWGAISAQEELRLRKPEEGRYWYELADSYNNLGKLKKSTDKLTEARELFEKAVAIREEWCRVYNKDIHWRIYIAIPYHNLGEVLYETGSPHEAKDAVEHAIEVIEELLVDSPILRTRHQDQLARSYDLLRLVRIELGEEKSPDLAPPSRWDDFKQLFKELGEDLQK